MTDHDEPAKATNMSPAAESTAARKTYEAYRETVGGIAVNGDPLPDWDVLSNKIQEGWRSAAGTGHRVYTDQGRMEAASAARQTVALEGHDGPSERIARAFHEAYERLAPEFGYDTREASAKPWEQVPDQNRNLMRAVAANLMRGGHLHPGRPERGRYPDRNDHYIPPGLRMDHRSDIVAEVGRPGRSLIEYDGARLVGGALGIMRAIVAAPELSGSDDDRHFWRALSDQARSWEARYREAEELVEERRNRTARVELAGADESNGGAGNGVHWFWADVSGDGSHWSHFEGHGMQVDVELHTYNEREQNDWKGRDEIRASGEWQLSLNRQVMADGYFGKDVGAALRKIDRLIGKLEGHDALDHRIATPYREQLIGRRVFYRETPAVVTSLTGDGCVMLRVVGRDHFPPAAWQVDRDDDELEPELDDEVKVELTSDGIWWWRKPQAGEPATQADWVALEAARREAEELASRQRKYGTRDRSFDPVSAEPSGEPVAIEVEEDDDTADDEPATESPGAGGSSGRWQPLGTMTNGGEAYWAPEHDELSGAAHLDFAEDAARRAQESGRCVNDTDGDGNCAACVDNPDAPCRQ